MSMRRGIYFKAVIGRIIVCLFSDRRHESGRNRWFSARVHTPESLSCVAEHKMHAYLPFYRTVVATTRR